VSPPLPQALSRLSGQNPAQEAKQRAAELAERCTGCGACAVKCAFLQRYGLPREQAGLAENPVEQRERPYGCSLCGLCAAVCPEGLDPGAYFLALRRALAAQGAGPLPAHRRLLAYEARGFSPRYTLFALPRGCDTVLFPGCALPGTRPRVVEALHAHLAKSVAHLGLVLSCCAKPSHDLGRSAFFVDRFGALREGLLAAGVRRVLVACPNCQAMFTRYGEGLACGSVYEFMAENGAPPGLRESRAATIHDPCPTRAMPARSAAVRALARGLGLTLSEMPSREARTICCGEGGGVGLAAPELAGQWTARRVEEAAGRLLLTSCAGCAAYLSRQAPAAHILDALFDPERFAAGRVRAARPPFTYLNRILLRRRMRKRLGAG
jgi:Fe-S oxidoreductase